MNSFVDCEKLTLLKALFYGYFCHVSQILSKKSGYLDHLGEVFLFFEIAYLWLLSLFSVGNKFVLGSILFLLVLLCWKYFCQCARLREEKEEEINFSWMQFYFEGPLIFDRKAHFLFEGMDLHPQPPQRNSQVRDSNPWLDRNKQVSGVRIEP